MDIVDRPQNSRGVTSLATSLGDEWGAMKVEKADIAEKQAIVTKALVGSRDLVDLGQQRLRTRLCFYVPSRPHVKAHICLVIVKLVGFSCEWITKPVSPVEHLRSHPRFVD